MKQLPVALSLVAVIGAVLSAVLFFQIGNSKALLQVQLDTARTQVAGLARKVAIANEQNEALEKRVVALDQDLGETKAKLTTTEARNVQLSRDLAQTKAIVTLHEESERTLSQKVVTLTQNLAEARAASVSGETVDAYKATIAELERRLAIAQYGAAAPSTTGASTAVFASRSPEPASCSVLSVGPENSFVVLDFGAVRGAATGQVFSIQRGTDVVAMVLISDVRPNFSVAQVQPESLHGALHKGDSAVLHQ